MALGLIFCVSTAAADAGIGSDLARKLETLRAARAARTASAPAPLRPPSVPLPPAAVTAATPAVATATDAEPDLADPDGVLSGLSTRRPADAIDWQPLTALPAAPDGIEETLQAPGLVVSADGTPYLLEPHERRISLLDPATGRLSLSARDTVPGLIEIADAAVLADGGLALADNRRQAVHLFRSFRHAATVGLIGERRLFRFIRHVFPLPGGRFGVTDSGANRSFLFSAGGDLVAELPGTVEPVWLAGSLVRLVSDDHQVRALAVDPSTGRETSLFTYAPPPGQIPLDARVIGTAAGGSELAVLVSEGAGDADHPAWSRVLRYRAGALRTASVLPDLSFDLSGKRSCILTDRGGQALLIALRASTAGTGLFAARLP